MNFKWDPEKNQLLKNERNVCFEDVVAAIHNNQLLDIIRHPNTDKYPHQYIYVLCLYGYVYAVPFVKDDNSIFLKTIIPSRKLHKRYGAHCYEA